MDKITIQKLCEKIEKEILSMTSVQKIYIGKTENIEEARNRHIVDFDRTEAIARSDAENINKAEKYAIDYFKNNSRMDNERKGGAGNTKADILYLSLKFNITHVDELGDNEISIDCYELMPINNL